MINDKLLQFFYKILGEYDLKTNNDVAFYCPACGHRKKKLEINLISGKWECWVCSQKNQMRGKNLYSLLKKINCGKSKFIELSEILKDSVSEHKKYKNDTIEDNVIIELPVEFKPLYKISDRNIEYVNAVKFLIDKRKLTIYDLIKYNIGYCESGKYKNHVIIPSYDKEHNLNYWVARNYYDNTENSYINPTLGKGSKNVIGFDFYINWSEPIVLTEGVFDAMTVKRNAIPLFGKTMSQRLYEKIIYNKVKSVYIVLDNDAMSDAIKIAERLLNNHIQTFIVELQDKDPSKIGFPDILDYIYDCQEVTFNEIIKFKLNNI